MVLDLVKKDIINAPDMAAAIQKLTQEYDSAAFSFWFGHYEKYEGEGEDYTRTANLLSNFKKEFLAINKFVFGTWGIYGDEPSLEIMGVCFWHHPERLTEL